MRYSEQETRDPLHVFACRLIRSAPPSLPPQMMPSNSASPAPPLGHACLAQQINRTSGSAPILPRASLWSSPRFWMNIAKSSSHTIWACHQQDIPSVTGWFWLLPHFRESQVGRGGEGSQMTLSELGLGHKIKCTPLTQQCREVWAP